VGSSCGSNDISRGNRSRRSRSAHGNANMKPAFDIFPTASQTRHSRAWPGAGRVRGRPFDPDRDHSRDPVRRTIRELLQPEETAGRGGCAPAAVNVNAGSGTLQVLLQGSGHRRACKREQLCHFRDAGLHLLPDGVEQCGRQLGQSVRSGHGRVSVASIPWKRDDNRDGDYARRGVHGGYGDLGSKRHCARELPAYLNHSWSMS
jgi:hypothetical protein